MTTIDAPQRTSRTTAGTLIRWALPFAVSGAFFAYLLSRIDVGTVLGRMTPEVALYFLPPLAVFLAVTLLIEAVCLVLVVSHAHPFGDLGVAARIKAASYLLGMLHYALGAGALTLLLRRRARMPLADAAGSVFLISLLDLGCVLALLVVPLAMLGSETPGVRAGVVVAAGLAIAAGFTILRAPVAMGPLDRLRDLEMFRAARTLPLARLVELLLLRFVFVAVFVLLTWSALAAFEISVPPLMLILNVAVLVLVSVLPIAAAGLGTGQLAFVALFRDWGDPETLLATSLMISVSLIVTRGAMGALFAREYAAEALAARREAEA